MKNDEILEQYEVVDGYRISKRRRRIWDKEIELALKFMEVCSKYKLSYYIIGGTLLGAYKYQGFIPWDDDMDFVMPPSDYEKFQQIAPNEFSGKYNYRDMNNAECYFGSYSRLRDNNTTGSNLSDFDFPGQYGIWIDIFRFSYVHSNKWLRNIQIKQIRFIQTLLIAKVYGKKYERFMMATFKWKGYKQLAYCFSKVQLIRMLMKIQNRYKVSDHITIFAGYRSEEYRILEHKDFESTTMLLFEGIEMPAPFGYINCLNSLYGEMYNQPYPQERKGIHHVAVLDPDTPYEEYKLQRNVFFNNWKQYKLIIFGAGKMTDYFLSHQGKDYEFEYIVDNNPEKWNTMYLNTQIKAPIELKNMDRETLKIVICSVYFNEIIDQLEEMGINQYYVFLDERVWL